VLSDNGPQFAARLTRVFTHVLGVKQAFTTTYRPQVNGQVERFNQTLADTLAHTVFHEQKDWGEKLGAAVYAYNQTANSMTGFTVAELALSSAPRSPTQMPDFYPVTSRSRAQFRQELLRRADVLGRASKERLDLGAEKMKYSYDAKVVQRKNVHLGDVEFVRTYLTDPATSPKLEFPVSGPFPVSKVYGPHIEIMTRNGPQTLHLDRVIRAPSIQDLPAGVEVLPPRKKSLNQRGPRQWKRTTNL
jgi:hypothetical protein